MSVVYTRSGVENFAKTRSPGARNFLIDFIRSLCYRGRRGVGAMLRRVIYSPFLDYPRERNYRRDV